MGRPPHIQTQETFTQFFESIPDEAKHRGYWAIKHETFGKTGGAVQANLGKIEVEANENYDGLRERVKERFATKRGPGTYYATATDEKGKEIKAIGQAKFEFSEKEIPMPEPPVDPGAPVRDAMQMAKRLAKDSFDMQQMEYSQKLLEKFLGGKKEEDVKETIPQSSSMNDMLLWKTLMDDGSKKRDNGDPALQQQLADLKLEQTVTAKVEKALGEIKAIVGQKPDDRLEKLMEKVIESQKPDDKFERLMEKLIEAQKPKEDSDIKRLLEKVSDSLMKPRDDDKTIRLLEQLAGNKQENAFQSMMALMVKQQEDRERLRMEDEKHRNSERLEADKRRIEDERRREDDRKDERKRLDDENKVDSRRLEERIELEKKKFEEELKEQRRRFDTEIVLRREEIKGDQEKSNNRAVEQQKFQIQLLDLFKNNKDTSLESTSKIVDAVVGAGLSSMKTAQEAAETIMEVAKNSSHHKEKKDPGSFLDNIKDIAQIAAPILGPIVDADSKMKLLQAASRMSGGAMQGGLAGLMGGMGQQQPSPKRTPQGGPPKTDIEAAIAAMSQMSPEMMAQIKAAMGGQVAPQAQAATQAPVAPSPTPASTSTSPNPTVGGAFGMIAQYLKAYPILRYALLGNIKDNLGVRAFMPVVTGLNQPTLEGLMANVPARVVMDEVKMTCNEEEAKLVDANEPWFVEFRKAMIAVLKEEEEDEDEEAEKASAPPAAK